MADSPALGQNVPNLNPEPSGLYLMDGIAGLRSLPEHSVDMLLTDPPYGTTRNYWDVPLPLPELWEAVRWAVKPSGAVLFFAQCPYDKVLGASNLPIVVMDNLRTHPIQAVSELLHNAGAQVLYLPPYSPDLNPIDKLWSKVKAILRKLRIRSHDALDAAIRFALDQVSADDCAGWFCCAGYCLF